MTDQDVRELGAAAIADLDRVMRGLDPTGVDAFVAELAAARRIALYGVGREGLMMKGLAMRLFHLGRDAHVVGDMTTPPIGAGDLLAVSAGPGGFSTVEALMATAKAAGARTACVTAQPSGAAPRAADLVFHIPAQTMADDQGGGVSALPMGSLFEGAQFVVFELVILKLRARLGETAETMRARHTNLE